MKAFQSITSRIIGLDLKDVDTDMIIPAQYLTSTSTGGYGKHLFQRLRDQDPDFPLHQANARNAHILVSQENFGCGSSREHAVWALLEHGIQVVIAPSFADIFSSNSGKNGLVLVALPTQTVQKILNFCPNNPDAEIIVDLNKQSVTLWDESEHSFFFDPFRKDCILKGHDDLDYLLDHQADIKEWQVGRAKQLYSSTLQPNHPLPS